MKSIHLLPVEHEPRGSLRVPRRFAAIHQNTRFNDKIPQTLYDYQRIYYM